MSSDRSASRRLVRKGGLVLVLLAGAILVYGITSRAKEHRELEQWTDEQAIPSVTLISPSSDSNARNLELPARLEAFARAPLYARASGYLKSWSADIGSQVKAGQVLGEIETPDLDQQILQAKADVASARVNAELAGTTAKRWQSMLGSDSVSRQEVDERTGDYAAKQAILQAAQANLDRIQANKGFTKLVAPFDGVVTARSTDVGALINVAAQPDCRCLWCPIPASYASTLTCHKTTPRP
ncbi:efflux RND transporter periplasmic adaptor subunit [Methylobacillus glycogenes]|uniref:efflux RND transporter periplasmic adaptor subunit n=1 Tax=Methylobacillus glycogenes TaxID=406 RepID=UPI000A533878|nr:efflux RND transporter periplasmic adaptor subunit [Methylobacillus glycogenes]